MKRRWSLVVVLLLLVLAALACSRLPGLSLGTPALPPEIARVSEVWRLLQEQSIFKEQLDSQEFSDRAIRSLLEDLDDPYASFLTPQEVSLHQQNFKGEIEGIGVEAGMREGHLTVIAPLPDTPASRVGIRPGDLILEVDGQPTAELTFLQVLLKIRGPKGTPVELLVQHPDESEPVRLSLVRETITTQTVRMKLVADNVAHIAITSFLDNSDELFRDALHQAKDQGATALILDLRNNPGGLVSSTVNIASQLLAEGLVFYQVDAKGKREEWKVVSGGIALELPVVVLVNDHSASASEIVAGALQARGRATVVGTRTFGKGTVNILSQLSDGSGLFFSIAYWYTPDGVPIDGQGITPDIEVKQAPRAAEDVQLLRALEHLRTLVPAPEPVRSG